MSPEIFSTIPCSHPKCAGSASSGAASVSRRTVMRFVDSEGDEPGAYKTLLSTDRAAGDRGQRRVTAERLVERSAKAGRFDRNVLDRHQALWIATRRSR